VIEVQIEGDLVVYKERVATLRLTRKAPYKVKNRKHPAMSRVMDSF
jgi:hypothetical protein